MFRTLGRYLYKYVLRILGIIAVLYGISLAFTIISSQTVEVEGSFGMRYFFTRLALPMPNLIIFALLFGTLEYLAIALLLIAFSTLQEKFVYWSCQVALWLIVASLWYQDAFIKESGVYNNLWPFNLSPTSLFIPFGITLFCSCILLILSSLFQKGLRRFFSFFEAPQTEQNSRI